MPAPFIKFPGGKGWLADTIISYFPKKYGTYYEPMVGGGAIFFELAHRGKLKKAVISDVNENLMDIYNSLQENLPSVLRYLKAMQKKRHKIITTQGDAKDLFYAIRKRVNKTHDAMEASAGLIYLSKTCYNGLFRFNQKGYFNAPVGDQKDPKICDETNLVRVSAVLKKATILCTSYQDALATAKKGDLVYIDPPYWPVRNTSFVSYNAAKFTKEDHVQLAKEFFSLANRGVYTVLSNSDTPEIKKMYRKAKIITVQAPRRINAIGSGRGLVKELLIKNF